MNQPSTFLFRSKIALLGCGFIIAMLGFYAGRFSATAKHKIAATRIAQPVPTNVVVKIEKKFTDPMSRTATASAIWNEQSWQQLLSQAATPARDSALADLIEKLATTDPDRAMILAQAEKNLNLRGQLIQAALHGWARTSPLAAANWALALPDSGERDKSLATIFSGAVATNPETAVAVGKILMEENPAAAAACGSKLIDALCNAGDFSSAAGLAASADSSQRNFWIGEAFSKWASFQPQAAAQAAQALADPEIRSQALHGIAGGWAEADPAGLIQFLAQLPAGGDRGEMLGQALKSWVQNDPLAAANWINDNNQFGSDLNQGAAEVATTESLPPQIALTWATSISDPQLRSATVASVVRDWLYDDLPAAENYIRSSKDLLPPDRQQLSEIINDLTRVSLAQ
ncbi:MAG TPA: hypothetical protein VFV23_01920 [Verrucomicrobiae bacterium]|nr:hypothetical protein [Verrucomicrobiae bacterium]